MRNAHEWIMLAPGKTALMRRPQDSIPEGARLATAAELITANHGFMFPWGDSPDPQKSRTAGPWLQYRMGMGGLIHDKWFGTAEGRFGGAPNVPDRQEHALRYCMILDGGACELKDNEGYAVVCDVDSANTLLYRSVQLYAARHVAADGGRIVLSPIGDDGVVYVGFGSYCFRCPSPEHISFRALQAEFPHQEFKLFPEWVRWRHGS